MQQIMICDDERDMRYLYSRALSKHYEVLETDSVRDCIRVFEDVNPKPDLVLMDYKLGDGSGVSAARAINHIQPTKVIMNTAYQLDADELDQLYNHNIIQDVIVKGNHTLAWLSEQISKVIARCPVCNGTRTNWREYYCSLCNRTGLWTRAGYSMYMHHGCDCLARNPQCKLCHRNCHCRKCTTFL